MSVTRKKALMLLTVFLLLLPFALVTCVRAYVLFVSEYERREGAEKKKSSVRFEDALIKIAENFFSPSLLPPPSSYRFFSLRNALFCALDGIICAPSPLPIDYSTRFSRGFDRVLISIATASDYL